MWERLSFDGDADSVVVFFSLFFFGSLLTFESCTVLAALPMRDSKPCCRVVTIKEEILLFIITQSLCIFFSLCYILMRCQCCCLKGKKTRKIALT